jgi:isopropylmalate/homocitrate/citramalate synthase
MNRGDHRIAELMVRENYKTYEEAKKAINPKNYTIEGPDVKQFFTSTQMSDLNGYGTEVPSDDILNEVDDVYEARKPSMLVKREIMKIIPVCLLMFALAAAGVVLYMVFLKPH